jgi:hypothetical protein
VRLLLDENFDNDLLRGLLLRIPELDYVRVQDIMAGADDRHVLAWAAEEDRILLTRDVQTMTAFAYDRVEQGLKMPGVVEISHHYGKGVLIDAIYDFITLSLDGEWEGQVLYLP